jgi:hypothetical protein
VAKHVALVVMVAVALSACAGTAAGDPAAVVGSSDDTTEEHGAALRRDPDVPDLPFEDNPDPNQCGIPTRWGLEDPAWLTGTWDGELIEPEVLLYDSHQRRRVTGRLPHGSEVRIVLFQRNPVLDFYFVTSASGSAEGWVPGPFVSFEEVHD